MTLIQFSQQKKLIKMIVDDSSKLLDLVFYQELNAIMEMSYEDLKSIYHSKKSAHALREQLMNERVAFWVSCFKDPDVIYQYVWPVVKERSRLAPPGFDFVNDFILSETIQ